MRTFREDNLVYLQKVIVYVIRRLEKMCVKIFNIFSGQPLKAYYSYES